jgi:hypothetical protein
MGKAETSEQEYFSAFIKKNLGKFIDSLHDSDCIGDIGELKSMESAITLMRPKDVNKLLRQFISERSVKAFSDRYRSSKYRTKRHKKTVQLEQDTHKKLLALKAEINATTVDEVLDYALSKRYDNDYDIIEAKENVGDEVFDPSVFGLPGFLMRLTKDDRGRLMLMLSKLYEDTWKTAKVSRSRRDDIIDMKMRKNRYLSSVFEHEGLANEFEQMKRWL